MIIDVRPAGPRKDDDPASHFACLWCGDDHANCECIEHGQMVKDMEAGLDISILCYGRGYTSQKSRIEGTREENECRAAQAARGLEGLR